MADHIEITAWADGGTPQVRGIELSFRPDGPRRQVLGRAQNARANVSILNAAFAWGTYYEGGVGSLALRRVTSTRVVGTFEFTGAAWKHQVVNTPPLCSVTRGTFDVEY